MKKKKDDIGPYMIDAVLERPYEFTVDERQFFLYPATLGKMLLSQQHIAAIGLTIDGVANDIVTEVRHIVKEKKQESLSLIAVYTCKEKEELFDTRLLRERAAFFAKSLNDGEIAALLLVILSSDKTAMLMKELGIDKEREKMMQAMKVKKSKNNLSFGGKTIYGSLIDAACERYGWSKDYVVWGIDYASLRLMLADKVESIFFTDDELKKVPASIKQGNQETIKATKDNIDDIKKMNWK